MIFLAFFISLCLARGYPFQDILKKKEALCSSCLWKSGKCCKIYTPCAVYQYNRVMCISSRKQDRNNINNLSDSPLFTFHLVSSLALGRIQSVSQHFHYLTIRQTYGKRESNSTTYFLFSLQFSFLNCNPTVFSPDAI